MQNSNINKFLGVLSVTISEVKSDEYGIYTELEAHHNSKLVSPQINDVKWKYLVLNKSGAGLDITQAFPMEQYGKTIKVYYNEEWYNKYLYFFPYYKSVDINLYSLWHIEQPLSLKFNGERLEILSNQVKEGSFQHYIKENYQSCILAEKEPEQEKVIDIFPKTDKMVEGEYYILLDEIENSIIPVYKPIPVCYNTHDGFTFSKTENTISKYQLLGGGKSIYLFNEYQEFVLKLKEIIKNKYNNKLYTYQGKTPIKLNVSYKSECIFPLTMEPVNSRNNSIYSGYAWDRTEGIVQTMFGSNRDEGKRKHAGIDLYTGETTSGEVVAIADGTILDARLFYNETYQISIYHEINGKPYIVRYGELKKIQNTKSLIGKTVKQGDKLGETGVLIKNGKPMEILNNKPMCMLHFEVFNMEIDGVSIEELKKIEGTGKYVLSNSSKEMSKPKYNRRKDIINPLSILKQGYEVSKKSGLIK